MRVTGLVVLAFIAYHLVHFTIGSCSSFFQGGTYKAALGHYEMQHDFHFIGLLLVQKGEHVHNVYDMVVRGFQSPIVSGFYILATGLLAFHLWHGIESMCQTLGIKTNTWGKCLRSLARVYCLAYFLGSLAIPGSVLAGCLKPTTAGCSSCCDKPAATAPATNPAH
jgi:succinate dehydrogenase / fumarate reductase cytochrome b subunit